MYYCSFRLISIYLLICILISVTFGSTYYVNRNFPNDGTGDINSPWLSISSGLANINSGDTLIVIGNDSLNPEYYEERITSIKPGNIANYTVVKAFPIRSVLMHGFFIQNESDSCVQVEGFQITTDLTGWDGCGIQIRSQYSNVIGNYIYGIGGNPAIKVHQHSKVIGNEIFMCQNGISTNGYCLIEQNVLHRNVFTVDGYDSDYFRAQGDSIILRNNFAYGTLESETHAYGAHFDFFQHFHTGKNGAPLTNAVIEGNRVFDYFDQGMIMEEDVPGASFNIIVRNNIFAGGMGSGIVVSDNVHDVKIYNNLFYGSAYGIRVYPEAEASIINNLFVNLTLSSIVRTGSVYDTANAFYNCKREPDNCFIQFVDTASHNFKYSLTSVGVFNTGVSLNNFVDYDIDSIPRPRGDKWDIGPFESEYSVESSSLKPRRARILNN